MQQDNTQEVMVALGTFENRVIHSTKKHPQIGYVHFEGQRRKVFIGFWGDCPVWKLADGEDAEYAYCAEKTMPIDDDPDYCGESSVGIEITVTPLNSETVVG